MRTLHLASAAISIALSIGCGSEQPTKVDADGKTAAKAEGKADARAKADVKAEAKADADADADAEVEGDVEVAAAAELTPRIGGTIVAAGDYNVEILAFVDGRIEAIVMDAKGELVAEMGKLELVATLAAEGEARAKVDLAWDPPSARFVGAVDGAVQLTPGAVQVEVSAGGDASVGMLAYLGLAVQAEHGGQVMVAGAYSLEIAAQAGFVHAYAFDVAGKAHAKGDLDIDLEVEGGTELELKWDPPSASYKAELSGDLDLEAKPVVVRVQVEGELAIAAVASFHASAAVAAKGDLDARAEADVRPPHVKAKVDAGAGGRGSAKAGAKVDAKKSASASGKASAKSGGGSAKAGASGKAKAKASFGFGG